MAIASVSCVAVSVNVLGSEATDLSDVFIAYQRRQMASEWYDIHHLSGLSCVADG